MHTQCLHLYHVESHSHDLQYISRNMHTVFALLCFVVVIHWLIFPYPSGLLHCHCGNLTIAPVPARQPWWIWINTSCEFVMNDCVTTTKQSTTKPCAYFLGYTVHTSKMINAGHNFLLFWGLTHCGIHIAYCAILRHIYGIALAEVLACCLKAPGNYLNQWWLFISEVSVAFTWK